MSLSNCDYKCFAIKLILCLLMRSVSSRGLNDDVRAQGLIFGGTNANDTDSPW
jgi:hypothetical protein